MRRVILVHVVLRIMANVETIIKRNSTAKGFEPLRAEPNGFLVHHLNHSVTLSCDSSMTNVVCVFYKFEHMFVKCWCLLAGNAKSRIEAAVLAL